jgi:hypothetical protein
VGKKSTGKIEELPYALRMVINQRLRKGGKDGQYAEIAAWLFAQPDDDSIPCSARWLSGSGPEAMDRAMHACKNALQRWYKGPFKIWNRAEDEQDENIRFVEGVEEKYDLLGDDADRRTIRSLLLELAPSLRNSDTPLADKAAAFAQISREIERQRKSRREDKKLALLEDTVNRAKEATTKGSESKGGLTPETLEQIERESKLL